MSQYILVEIWLDNKSRVMFVVCYLLIIKSVWQWDERKPCRICRWSSGFSSLWFTLLFCTSLQYKIIAVFLGILSRYYIPITYYFTFQLNTLIFIVLLRVNDATVSEHLLLTSIVYMHIWAMNSYQELNIVKVSALPVPHSKLTADCDIRVISNSANEY